MARILFTWELGGGLGHTLSHRALMEALITDGHEIWFAMRNLEQAAKLFEGIEVHCIQAPRNIPDTNNPYETISSYAHLLHNVIFHSIDSIKKTTKEWQQIFARISPDVLIADHSPGALFASRGLPLIRTQIGTGFTIAPNSIEPMPNLRNWLEVDKKILLEEEKQVLGRLNKVAMDINIPVLPYLAELYKADRQYLMTFSELDHITKRNSDEYYGITISGFGEDPLWPEVKGKKIFAYLKPFKTITSLLSTLKTSGLPTLIYYAGKITKDIKGFECESLKIVENTLNISKVAPQCDVAITHAGHGTATELLLAGCPLLLLPLNLEQYMFAERVSAMGAGLSAPLLKPEGMAGKLHLLLSDPAYKLAANAFSSKYSDCDNKKIIADIVEDINSTLKENK